MPSRTILVLYTKNVAEENNMGDATAVILCVVLVQIFRCGEIMECALLPSTKLLLTDVIFGDRVRANAPLVTL